ncbi:hypothetical protein ACFPRL_25755 [Pseudoclavibacter helvolus]
MDVIHLLRAGSTGGVGDREHWVPRSGFRSEAFRDGGCSRSPRVSRRRLEAGDAQLTAADEGVVVRYLNHGTREPLEVVVQAFRERLVLLRGGARENRHGVLELFPEPTLAQAVGEPGG